MKVRLPDCTSQVSESIKDEYTAAYKKETSILIPCSTSSMGEKISSLKKKESRTKVEILSVYLKFLCAYLPS